MPRRRNTPTARLVAMEAVELFLVMEQLDRIERIVQRVFNMETKMATKADFDAAVTALTDGIADLGTDVQAVLDKLAAGQAAGGLSQADLDAAVTTLTGVSDKIKTIDSAAETAVAAATPPTA